MGAAAEATRGPIEEVTYFRHGMSRSAAETERRAAMNRVLAELEPVLAEPVYEGDVQTALLHNMGRAAFGYGDTGDDDVRDYITFSEAIGANTDEGPTPVMLVSQIRPGAGTGRNTETALVMVDPEETTFRSRVVHIRGVREAGYAGKVAVTRRSLSLVGDTSMIHADISGRGRDRLGIDYHAQTKTGQSELVLSERSIIDGRNGSKPIGLGHDGYRRDIDRMWAGPTYLIGWKNIGNALASRIYESTRGHREPGKEVQGTLPYVLYLRSFLERTEQLEVLLEHHASLKKIFEHAVGLEESVAALAPAEDYDD